MRADIIENDDDSCILVVQGLTMSDINRLAIQGDEYEQSQGFATTSGSLALAIEECRMRSSSS